jgi:hypothetical protein
MGTVRFQDIFDTMIPSTFFFVLIGIFKISNASMVPGNRVPADRAIVDPPRGRRSVDKWTGRVSGEMFPDSVVVSAGVVGRLDDLEQK